MVFFLIYRLQVVHYTTLYSIDDDTLNIHFSYCVERWPVASRRRAYSILTFGLQFCLPLIATVALYARIYVRLRARRRLRIANRRNNVTLGCRRQADRTSTTHGGERTTRILIAIVVSFVACWLPWNVLSLIAEMDRSAVSGHNFKLIELGLKTFALIGSSCINPVFYSWLNDGFRSELIGSLANVRLRVFAPTSEATSRATVTHVKRLRLGHANGDQRLTTAADGAAETAGRLTEIPRWEVCVPSLLIDGVADDDGDAPRREAAGFSRMTRCDQLTWCALSAGSSLSSCNP